MSNIDKIRQKIERLKGYISVTHFAEELLSFIDSLPDQPVEGLEEAAENYIAPIENDEGLDYINFNGRDIKDAFIAGAKWQKGQQPEVEICPHSIKSKSYKEITGDETR